MLKQLKMKEAFALSFLSAVIVILAEATFLYSLRQESGMATATATMILVVITGFYAWNTHIQIKSMDVQANLIREQTDVMKGQFDLATKGIKRDIIEKEIDLLILPLKIIYSEIDSKGIDKDWWALYTQHRMKNANPDAYTKFDHAVYSVDQNKYLAPKNLYPLIEDFITRLKNMKKSDGDNTEHKEALNKATKELYYKGNRKGGLVEERHQELTTELQALE